MTRGIILFYWRTSFAMAFQPEGLGLLSWWSVSAAARLISVTTVPVCKKKVSCLWSLVSSPELRCHRISITINAAEYLLTEWFQTQVTVDFYAFESQPSSWVKSSNFGGWKELFEFFIHILFQLPLNYRPFVAMKATQVSTYHLNILWRFLISLNDSLNQTLKTQLSPGWTQSGLIENWSSLDLSWWHIWQYFLSKGFKRS